MSLLLHWAVEAGRTACGRRLAKARRVERSRGVFLAHFDTCRTCHERASAEPDPHGSLLARLRGLRALAETLEFHMGSELGPTHESVRRLGAAIRDLHDAEATFGVPVPQESP